MHLVLAAIASLLLVILLQRKWGKHLQRHGMPTIPGPRPLPFIGNLLDFGFDRTAMLANFVAICSKHDGICKVFMGPKVVTVVVSEAKYLRKIFKTSSEHIEKTELYAFYEALGQGILCCKGELWHGNRKRLQPAFQYKMLGGFTKVFNAAGNRLIENLEAIVGAERNIVPYMNEASLEIIYESALGLAPDEANKGNILEYSANINKYVEICMERFFSLAKRSNFLFKLTSDYKRQRNYLLDMNAFTRSKINERRLDRERSDAEDLGIKTRPCFLDILLDAYEDEQELPYEYITHELNTILIAGHHTLTSIYSFLMYELSKREAIQERLFDEISAKIADVNDITVQEINDLGYLECVIREGLRLNPPVPLIERVLDCDTELDGSTIPRGTNINIFIYLLHRSEEAFPDPLTFDPDRFSADVGSGRDPLAYCPFGIGARNCIGWKYALNQMKCLLAKIIYNYRMQPLTSDFEPQIFSDGALKSKNGFLVHLIKRFNCS